MPELPGDETPVPEQVKVSPEARKKAAELAAERGLPDEPEPAPVETRAWD
jgi:hypothetical protein